MIIIVAGTTEQVKQWAQTNQVHGQYLIVTPRSNPVMLGGYDARNLIVINEKCELTPELGYVLYRCFFQMSHGQALSIRDAISDITKGGRDAIDAYEAELAEEKAKKETA